MPRSWSEAVKACRQHPKKINGRWCSCRTGWRYRLGLPDAVTGLLGKPTWSSTFPTKAAADDHQRVTRQAIADRSFTRDRGLTVADFLTAWLRRKATAGRKATTLDGYRIVVENYLLPGLGRHRIGDLRPDHVQALLDRCATAPNPRSKVGEPLSAGTLVNIRAVLRAALGDALRQELVSRNVAQLVTLPTVRRPRPVAVDDGRLLTFIKATEGDPLEACWLMAAVYGPRRGELLGLRWEDVDQAARVIRVRQTIVEVAGDHRCPHCDGTHKRLLFDTPKSHAGERAYPLVPPVVAALMAHRLRQDHDRELYGATFQPHGLVFCRPGGDPWRPAWVSAEFKRIMRSSGAAEGMARIPSLKVLRSTMVSNLSREGLPVEVIARAAGHADGGVTGDHYLSVSAERTRSEFEILARRLQ